MKPYHLIAVLFCLTTLKTIAQQPTFNQYKVPLYTGHKASLRIKGNDLAERYRTRIRNTYNSKEPKNEFGEVMGLNFAGHYCFVYWGCGSPCKASAVVDIKTGIVYDGITAAMEFRFKSNSRLMLVDPDVRETGLPYKPEYWEWKDSSKRFVKISVHDDHHHKDK